MMYLKSGVTIYAEKHLNYFVFSFSPADNFWRNIRYSFGDDGQIFGFGQIVKPDLRPISSRLTLGSAPNF